jgi:N-methylhydantoinase A/oxoprolinase/acetone carboxylase beta subunit
MKLKIIACGVFEPELARLAEQSPHDVVVELLEAGLHDRPDLLREQTQAAIERAEAAGCDAVGLGYGLCGRGVSGLIARSITVVIPRAHDCMTLFMGSRAAYRKQFSAEPGTFYITAGWYDNKVRPLGHDKEKHYDSGTELDKDPRFAPLAEKYGPERAAYIIHFHDSWKRNYTRAAFIDTGAPNPDKYAAYTAQMAEDLGWRYECVAGDVHLLRKLVNGEWDEDEFLILKPGQRSAASGDDRILTAIDIEAGGDIGAKAAGGRSEGPAISRPAVPPSGLAATRESTNLPSPAPLPKRTPASAGEGTGVRVLGLGLDAGGTYTDCVLYDLATRDVLAKAKAITTHHNLMLGIDEGLRALTLPDPSAVRLVALSTTLATNSIVEGKGGRPGALIMSPLSGAGRDVPWQPLRHVSGAMDIRGDEIAPPDRDEIAQAVRDLLADGVDAFAVSGYASVRNPDHELLVREVIGQQCALPVVCGHELSQRLDYLARANTAILNARLLSVIDRLLSAVKQSLDGLGVHAPIMVVKGDGSLINEQTARERPVETVLSGPAASVSGARHLTDVAEGIVFDMGGTTTDSAVLCQGMARLHPEGALVGGWRTSVEAAQISTIGLGGDSHLAFNADRDLLIGPRRVLPISYLAAQAPQVMESLQRLDPRFITSRNNSQVLEFFRLGRDHEDTPLDERDRRLLSALQAGPLSREGLSRRLGLIEASLLRTDRLEDLGFVQRCSLTPTDLLHVTGEFTHWDVTAARRALDLFAELYGADPDTIIERIRDEIVRRLCLQVVRHAADDRVGASRDRVGAKLQLGPGSRSSGEAGTSPLRDIGQYLLDLGLTDACPGPLQVTFTYHGTIVALGAPVHPFFPEVARRLNARLIIPEHAEVANAIGAVASEVVVREKAVVRPGELSAYVVHSRSGKREYEQLETALEAAKQEAGQLASERAARSGAAEPKLRLDVDERRALLADGQEELIEVIIEATASGRPVLEAAS